MICYKNFVKMVCTYHFSKKKKVVIDLWQWHCRNSGEKNCENEFVQWYYPNRRKKIVTTDLWQGYCPNSGEKKKGLIFGNGIAEKIVTSF